MNHQADIIRFIEWAFYRGYTSGKKDSNEGVYIDSKALKNNFLKQIKPNNY